MPIGASPPDPFGGTRHDVGGLQLPVAFEIPLRRDFRMRGREVVDPLHRHTIGTAGARTGAQHGCRKRVPRVAAGAAADGQPRVCARVPADNLKTRAGIRSTPDERLMRQRPRSPRGLAGGCSSTLGATGIPAQHRVGVAVPDVAAYQTAAPKGSTDAGVFADNLELNGRSASCGRAAARGTHPG